MKKEDKGDLNFEDAIDTVRMFAREGLRNVRFSGGEPTLWGYLETLILSSLHYSIERIALSTNGSADLELYKGLIKAGLNDISISLHK